MADAAKLALHRQPADHRCRVFNGFAGWLTTARFHRAQVWPGSRWLAGMPSKGEGHGDRQGSGDWSRLFTEFDPATVEDMTGSTKSRHSWN